MRTGFASHASGVNFSLSWPCDQSAEVTRPNASHFILSEVASEAGELACVAYIGLFLIFLLLSLPANALAEKRVALLIGNSAYKHAPQLANPRNDAADMAAKVEGLGFEVVSGEDLDFASMRNAAREFTKKLEGADLSLFFYAGHGLQVNGSNFMAPVDAQLASYNDLDYETLPMDLIVTAMERNSKVNLVFLDACRDNPLAENLARSMGTRSGSVGRGLSKQGNGVGSLIAFATQPGNVALDGDGRNSPFTTELLSGGDQCSLPAS